MAYDSSAANRLTAVRAAIDACLTAQIYSQSGRMKQMAALRELRNLEKDIVEEVNAGAAGGSMCSLGIQVPPSG